MTMKRGRFQTSGVVTLFHAVARIRRGTGRDAATLMMVYAFEAATNAACRALVSALATAIAFAIPQISAAQSIEVKDVWLKRNCLDRGTSDYPLVGKEFEACLRKQIEGLPALDKNRREFFGERYDPPKYVECRLLPGNRNSSACNVFILRRREWPEYWPENAVRPKWPATPKESVYRKGMKPREYWEALCKAEAGEFIYKTVKDVEGFLVVRPRGTETDYATQDKYVVEDAYGFLESQFYSDVSRPGRFFFVRSERNYRFLESGTASTSRDRKWLRQEVDMTVLKRLLVERSTQKWDEADFSFVREVPGVRSRYGSIWRGIRREHDIEMGISGGELLISDLQTGERIALRRGFALDPLGERLEKSHRRWLSSRGCPVVARDAATRRKFLHEVLSPLAR